MAGAAHGSGRSETGGESSSCITKARRHSARVRCRPRIGTRTPRVGAGLALGTATISACFFCRRSSSRFSCSTWRDAPVGRALPRRVTGRGLRIDGHRTGRRLTLPSGPLARLLPARARHSRPRRAGDAHRHGDRLGAGGLRAGGRDRPGARRGAPPAHLLDLPASLRGHLLERRPGAGGGRPRRGGPRRHGAGHAPGGGLHLHPPRPQTLDLAPLPLDLGPANRGLLRELVADCSEDRQADQQHHEDEPRVLLHELPEVVHAPSVRPDPGPTPTIAAGPWGRRARVLPVAGSVSARNDAP